MESLSAISRPRVSTGIAIIKSKSLSSTTNGSSIGYPIPYGQYSYPQQEQQYQSQRPQAPSQQVTNICQLCNSQGQYDYQCQFAGDFMARMQKAFNQGRSYSHQDPNHGEWSQGDNDNNDPNGQPFQ